ncbi:uncharacterized protein LOC123513155 isoform X4 [Portunus trituberculatus]|uniref:uncharacterized protein LOC123513155 isoform X4 n=1 Tax=Portunus trituberculatus TaxID=210409 RepID=UPI001E1CBD45|nr:uncharacterized protein LOC123513155 isoform X4 [Portunus trituberculatus]
MEVVSKQQSSRRATPFQATLHLRPATLSPYSLHACRLGSTTSPSNQPTSQPTHQPTSHHIQSRLSANMFKRLPTSVWPALQNVVL